MIVDMAICYLIVGLIIATGIVIRYPRNTKATVFGYEFKTQIGAQVAGFFLILLMWPAAILFGEFE